MNDDARRGGFSLREYEARVWDMARHLLHPAFLYVAAQVVGATRLLEHPAFAEPGAGTVRQLALFAAGFLGAWACFYSTLLRDAGLKSLAVTVLVPLAWLAALAVLFAFPPPAETSGAALLAAALCLAGPGPVGWVVTMVTWRRARRARREDRLP